MTWLDDLLAQRKPEYMKYYLWPADLPRYWNVSLTDEVSPYYKERQTMIRGFLFAKSALYLPGIVLQIMAIIFLALGKSGYSQSARRWFLIVLACDFASNFMRIEELVINDTIYLSPTDYLVDPLGLSIGRSINGFIWGYDKKDEVPLRETLCYIVHMIIYLPFFMSPIALSISGVVRAYSVKFPLKAKAFLTRKVDWILTAAAAALTIGLSVSFVYLGFQYTMSNFRVILYGRDMYNGNCLFPNFHYIISSKSEILAAYYIMLAFSFGVCALNLVSAVVIIFVLYEAKKARKSMSAQEKADGSAELRATVMLLAMNFMLIICFLISRIFFIITSRPGMFSGDNFLYSIRLETTGSLLMAIPYLLNSMFVVGLNRKFYEFFFPCLRGASASSATSSTATKTQSLAEKKSIG